MKIRKQLLLIPFTSILICGFSSFHKSNIQSIWTYRIGTYSLDSLTAAVPALKTEAEKFPAYRKHIRDSVLMLDSIWYDKYMSYKRDSTGWSESQRSAKWIEVKTAEHNLKTLEDDTSGYLLEYAIAINGKILDLLEPVENTILKKYKLDYITENENYSIFVNAYIHPNGIHYYITSEMITLLTTKSN